MAKRRATGQISGIDDPRYVKALAHPLRIRILAMLGERDASPVQLAEYLDATLGTIAYHVRALEQLGLIELAATRQRRGAIEHIYTACPHPSISEQAWAGAGQIAKQALVGATLAQAGEYATRSATAGGFDRPDAYAGRIALTLDEAGWTEMAEAVKRFREQTADIEQRSLDRIKSEGGPPALDVGLVLLFFEALPFFNDAAAKVQGSDSQPKPAAARRSRRSSENRSR